MADEQLPPTVPSAPEAAEAAEPVPTSDALATAVPTTWWQRNHRRFWLWLAFLAAVTAPLWGGLLLLWLFSPSSPFPQG